MTTPEKLLHARLLEAGLRMLQNKASEAHKKTLSPIERVAFMSPESVTQFDVLIDHAAELVEALRGEMEATWERMDRYRDDRRAKFTRAAVTVFERDDASMPAMVITDHTNGHTAIM